MRSSTRQWYALLFVALILGSSNGFQIISQSSVVTVTDGNPHENMQFTVMAEASDFGQSFAATFLDSKNNTRNMTISFPRPNLTVATQVLGYIPRRKLLVARTVVLKESAATSSAAVQAYANDTLVLQSPKLAPVLAAIGTDKTRMLMNDRHYHSEFVAAGMPRRALARKPVFRQQSFAMIAALAVGIGMTFFMGMGSRGGATNQADLSAALNAQNARLDEYRQSIDGMNTKILNIADNLQAVQEKQADIIRSQQDQIQNLTDFTTGLFLQANAANLQYAQDTRDVFFAYKLQMQDNLDVIYENQANISAALNTSFNYLDEKIVNVSGSVDKRFAIVNTTLNNLVDAINSGVAITMSHVEDITGMIRDAIGLMRRFNAKIDLRILMPNLFTQSRTQWEGQGSIAFINDQGIDANTSSPLYYKTMIDKIWITYAYNDSASTVRHVAEQIRYYCNTDVVLWNTVALNTFQDVFTGVGPAGCNPNNGSCSCWTEHSYATCRLTNAGVAALNTTWFRDAMYVNNSLCTAPATIEPLAQVTSPYDFEARLRYPHCLNKPAFGGFYNVFSYQGGAKTEVPWVTSLCNKSLSAMAQDTFRFGYVWKIGNFLSNGYAAANLYLADLIIAKHGRISNDVTFTATQYRDSDGAFATAETFGYLVVPNDHDWLPVYRLSLVGSEASFSVSFDGKLYSFSQGAVVSPVLGISSSDVRYVIGDPRNTSVIYDIPTDLISVVNNTYAQYDKVTCMLCQNNPNGVGLRESGCDRRSWDAANPSGFDAFHCSVAASLFETGLNPDGTCHGARQPGSGSWCEVRDHYSVEFTDQLGPVDRIKLGMKDGSFIGTMALPTGTVFQQFTTACPNVELQPSLGKTQSLTLKNSQRSNIIVNVVRYGEPCSQNMSVAVGPTSTATLVFDATCVPSCDAQCQLLNPSGVASYVMVTAVDGEGRIIQCNDKPLVIDNSTYNIWAELDVMTKSEVDVKTSVSYDTTSLSSLRMMHDLIQAMYTMMYTTVTILASSGIPLTPLNLERAANMSKLLNDIAEKAANDSANGHGQSWPDLNDAYDRLKKNITDMNAKTNTFMADMSNKFADVQGDLTTLTGLLGAVNDSIASGRTQAAMVKAAGEAYYNATVNVSNELKYAFAHISSSSVFGDFLFGGIEDGIEGAVKWAGKGFKALISEISKGVKGFVSILMFVGITIGVVLFFIVLYFASKFMGPMCSTKKEKAVRVDLFMEHYASLHKLHPNLPAPQLLRQQINIDNGIQDGGRSIAEMSQDQQAVVGGQAILASNASTEPSAAPPQPRRNRKSRPPTGEGEADE